MEDNANKVTGTTELRRSFREEKKYAERSKKFRETKARNFELKVQEEVERRMKEIEKDKLSKQTVEELTESVTKQMKKEEKQSTPWQPAKYYDIPAYLKDPRFVYRMVNTKKEGNELKKLQEGWEYDTELAAKLDKLYGKIRTLNDGTPIDSHYRIREMIVMRMPKEMADARNKYYMERGNIDSEKMKQSMRREMPNESQEAGVYADSFGLKNFNKEEIFRR